MLVGLRFDISEHYIQYQKAMLFKDNQAAQAILSATTPYEVKKIRYQVQDFDMRMWKQEGYKGCYRRVKVKFQQNLDLLGMLVSNKPKLLVEASTDKLGDWSVATRH